MIAFARFETPEGVHFAAVHNVATVFQPNDVRLGVRIVTVGGMDLWVNGTTAEDVVRVLVEAERAAAPGGES